jgi:polyferredoxin
MNDAIWIWAKLFLRLGAVLLVVGLVPLALTATMFTTVDQLIPVILSLSVAPLGALCLLAGLILCLAALLRRRSGPS